MRFVSYSTQNSRSWGVVASDTDGEQIIDLCHVCPTLREAIERDLLGTIELKGRPVIPLKDVVLDPPIVNPGKILCIGVNYANRNEEYKDGSEAPSKPSVFIRFPESFTGHNQSLIRPPESHQLDYEGEIVLVIGKGGRRIKRDDAFKHIAGLTIMNEGTLRDWVRHAKFNVTQGKNFDKSGSVGPWMVSADEFSAEKLKDMKVVTRVNSEVRQEDTTASMMFPIDFIIEYISTFCTLKAGDLIATGTPNGAGARFDPPKYLKPGDVVEVEVEGIGKLINYVADESF